MLTYNDLHNYQKRAIEFILEKKRCALYLDMGLGKTISTLTAVQHLIKTKAANKALVIAPLQVAINTWHTEISKWEHLKDLTYSICVGSEAQRIAALKEDVDIYIINRENVQWLFEKAYQFDVIIIDESSSFKNPKSKRFRALRTANYKYMIQLSGTPSPNSLLDLWSQIFLLDRGERLGRTFSIYRNVYFYSDSRGFKFTVKNPDLIYKKIEDITLSMQAKDYLELPDRIDVINEVEIPNYKAYKKFEKDFIMSICDTEITAATSAVLTNKLLQYCNGAIYDELKNIIEIHDAKLDALECIIESSYNSNILVAYNYKSDLERLMKRFKHAVQLTSDPAIVSNWNSGKIKLLLAHPASASMGLNLQDGGSNVVWFGLTWNLEHYLQFNARLHRQGQLKPVVINHIVAKKGMDERVLKVLKNKDINLQDLLQSLIKEYA